MESSLQACCFSMWKTQASTQWLEAFETTALLKRRVTMPVMTDGWLELVVKHSDAITKLTRKKAHKAHPKPIRWAIAQSPIQTDWSFNHRYMHATVPNDKPCSSLIRHGCCLLRFPSGWAIAGGIWSDDKAGASVAQHALHFPKRRERSATSIYRLPSASPLCCQL